MSRYTYDYTIAPARPTGWRSVLTNLVVLTAVVLLSVISGAVVAYDLVVGQAREGAPPAVAVAAPIQVPVQAPIPAPAVKQASVVPSSAAVPAPEAPKVTQPAAHPEVVGTVTAPAAPQAPVSAPPSQSAQSAPRSQNDSASISSGDLTFAKGYAQRRAAQQAAAAQAATANKVAAAAKAPTANVNVAAAAEKQFGRPAVKRKPSSVLAQNARNERYGMFERFDGSAHHEALAFGDSSPSRPTRRMNSGGWFDGLF
jgi:hypothetical protein